MRLQLHDGPLPLRGGGVLRGEAGHRDAGGRVLHGRDELRPALEGLLVRGQEAPRVQAVAGQRQRLLDQVLGQVELLGHGVNDAQVGLAVREKPPEQAPVPLGEPIVLVVVAADPDPASLLFLHTNVPVRAALKRFSHIRLVNGREGFGRPAVMFAGLIQSVTTIVP